MKLHFDHKNIDEKRFPLLFTSIVLFFVGSSTFTFFGELFRTNILIAIIIGVASYTVSSNRKVYFSAILSGVLFFGLRLLDEIFIDESHFIVSLSILFLAVFFALIFKAILQYLLLCDKITGNVILGVISGYLLIGILFSFLFIFLFSIEPAQTINFNGTPAFSDFIYFSMITLSTVGYGDVLPLSDLARLSSYALGIFGQLYIGIVMALIIGKFLQSKEK